MATLLARLGARLPRILCTAVLAAGVILLIGGIALSPTYRASADLFIGASNTENPSSIHVNDPAPADEKVLNSEIQTLTGHSLIERLVDDLALDQDTEFNHATHPWRTRNRMRHAPDVADKMHKTRVIGAVLAAIRVTQVPRSAVLKLTATTHDPVKSARIVNKLADLYLEEHRQFQRDERDRTTTWLAGRLTTLQNELAQNEQAIAEFKAQVSPLDPGTLLRHEIQLADLRGRMARLQLSGTDAQTEHPSHQQFHKLSAAYDDLSAYISDQNNDLYALQQLNQQTDTTRALHTHYLTHLKSVSATEGALSPDSRVLSYALLPAEPIGPRIVLWAMMAAMLTLLFGILSVLLGELRNTRFRTARELAQYSGYPVLAHSMAEHHLNRSGSDLLAENLRTLRSAVLFATNPTPKTVMIGAIGPDDDASIITAALAHSLSDLGKRVLIIKCDDNSADSIPETDDRSGPSPDQIITRDSALRADVMSLTSVGQKAGNRLILNDFDKILSKVQDDYDHLLVSAPPILSCPEAHILRRYADNIVATVNWDVTHREQLDTALSMLEREGTPVLGLVMTQVNTAGLKRYGLNSRSSHFIGFHAGYGAQ